MSARCDSEPDVRATGFPWDWRPLTDGWFRRLRTNSSLFEFDPRLGLDERRLRAMLGAAAEARRGWLIHPALSLLTDPPSELSPTLGRHLLLAAWIAANGEGDAGPVELPETLLLWTPAGPRLVPNGRHDLEELGAELADDAGPSAIGLDPSGATLDGMLEDAWVLAGNPSDGADGRSICDFLSAMALLERRLPWIAEWASRVTRIVVPFRSEAPQGFRSCSAAEFPGLIRMDIGYGGLRILEALLHESAHRYFYHCETEQAFVEDLLVDRLFPSPLKTRPRPLRSVMLAYHALAYIVAGFTELAGAGLIGASETFNGELGELRRATAAAQDTCLAAAALLTDNGFVFLENTRRVADHGLAG